MPSTRFRAYQLDSEGSSFSYCYNGHFTLIEARVTSQNAGNINFEINNYALSGLDCLHITSWDVDHCNPDELQIILNVLKPKRIEYPGYTPHTDSARQSLKIIQRFESTHSCFLNSITPLYLKQLDYAKGLQRTDILYWPKELRSDSNDNSTVQLFRRGGFTVLSLGDIDSKNIAESIMNCSIIQKEVDVMILSHHGSNNGVNTSEFISNISPQVAICSSEYDGRFEHPHDTVRSTLAYHQIPLFTTKSGDIIIESLNNPVGHYRIYNFISNNQNLSSVLTIAAKTY